MKFFKKNDSDIEISELILRYNAALKKYAPLARLRLISHVLGLPMAQNYDKYPLYGAKLCFSDFACKERFALVHEKYINFIRITDFKKELLDFETPVCIYDHAEISKKISAMRHGEYFGWSSFYKISDSIAHCISINIIRENDYYHVILINRNEDIFPKSNAITIHKDEACVFIEACKKICCNFEYNPEELDRLFKKNSILFNNELKKRISEKSVQLNPNCCTANINIAWHFQIACEKMKNIPFLQAYDESVLDYKILRSIDRALAFLLFTTDKEIKNLYKNEVDYYNHFIYICIRFSQKELNVKKPEAVFLTAKFLLTNVVFCTEFIEELKKAYALAKSGLLTTVIRKNIIDLEAIGHQWSYYIKQLLRKIEEKKIESIHDCVIM